MNTGKLIKRIYKHSTVRHDVKICFVKGRVASRSHKHPPVRFLALKRVVQPRLLRREILSTPSSCCCSLVNNGSHWIPGLDLGWLRLSGLCGQKKNSCFIRRASIMKRWKKRVRNERLGRRNRETNRSRGAKLAEKNVILFFFAVPLHSPTDGNMC